MDGFLKLPMPLSANPERKLWRTLSPVDDVDVRVDVLQLNSPALYVLIAEHGMEYETTVLDAVLALGACVWIVHHLSPTIW